MSQGHRRHGGRGYTLLYYIGLEVKEDRRTEEQKKDKRDGKRKDRRTEDRRTKEQKQVERGTGARGKKDRKKINGPENGRAKEQEKGARGPEKARKLSPDALEQPYRAPGAMLQLSCSIVTELLEKVYGGGWVLRRNTLNDAVLPPKENIFGILFGRYKKNRYLCNAFRKHGRLAQLV